MLGRLAFAMIAGAGAFLGIVWCVARSVHSKSAIPDEWGSLALFAGATIVAVAAVVGATILCVAALLRRNGQRWAWAALGILCVYVALVLALLSRRS